ncbi:MAG: hypothetical protein M3Q46_12015 [Verrucomicrobiota bacterium]|nr:hypothetical protein [Verrucomicrobiota bacterium]
MIVLALVLALAIGVSLGLLGSGGSIITLPVLVYAAKVPAAEAVGMSLAIAGMLAGRRFASQIETERLRRWFAWFVLAVAIFVVAENWKVFR